MDVTRRTYESPRGVAPYDTRALRAGEEHVITTYCQGKRVLDLGCGSGRTTATIAKVAASVVGVDYSGAMIARAKELEPSLDLRVMDARQLDLPDASFDVAFFSFNGLDYVYPLEGRVQVLRQVHRVLAPGGVFAYAAHAGTPKLRLKARRLLGWLYGGLHGYRLPYVVRITAGGPLATCYLPEEVQRDMLREEGFRLLEVIPVTKGERVFIAQKI